MPYINIQITKEGVTAGQKAALIKGVTDLLVRVLDKNPATTVVVIDEVEMENWEGRGRPCARISEETCHLKVCAEIPENKYKIPTVHGFVFGVGSRSNPQRDNFADPCISKRIPLLVTRWSVITDSQAIPI